MSEGVATPGHLVAYHAGNQALTRLLGQTLLLERVHDAARRAFLETPTSRELLLKGVTRQLERDLASMAMPRPLVRYPEAFLDRLAQLALSTLDPKHLHAVRVLAQLPGPVSREFVEGMSEGLSDAPLVLRTVKPFLDLNPEARRAALLEDHVMVETRSTVDRRRRILDFPLTDGAFGKKAVSRAVDAVLRGDLGFLDLSEGPYAELIDLLLEPLHRATNALGSAPAMSLLKRLLLSDMAHATNLSLLERAKQLQLYGRELQEAAGIDWARANDGLAQLRAAFWIADHLRRIRSSLTRDLGFGDGLSKRSRLETDDVWLLALQAWRFARLRQGGGWHGILGLGTMPRPRDPAWDRGRHKDGALPEAAGEASGSEDESPNKDGVLSPMEEWDALWEGVPLRITKLTDVSDETLGEAYRTKALERPVGLIDRALSIAAESRSEHVGPDYNRIDVHTDLTPRGDDAKWRQEAVEYAKESADYFEKAGYLAKSARSMLEAALLASPDSEKRKDLRKEADSRKKKARKKPHADFNNLEPYFQLIGAFMDNKLWDKGATDLEELSHDLQQTGHWYLAGIVDEIKARLDNIQEV